MIADRLTAALSDRYRIERELGAGGMATVYLAEDIKHHRKVALKVLRPDLAATLGAERFLREITIAAGLQHPHVLPLHDSGEADGFLYYVMPYVDGTSVRDRLGREGELPVHEAVRILRDVADALAYSHKQGVVHRDIKPENVMLSGRHAVVTDFGVAKAVSEATGRHQLTTMGVALGTPAYMSPEQATADPHVDHRADIYALGAMAYELLTGRPPFVGVTPQQVLAAHVTEAAEPVTKHRASIPAPLADLIAHCLEKKPADRPQSADELIPLLEALLTPSGGLTPTSARMSAVAQPAARRSLRWMAGAAVVVLFGALAVIWSRRGTPASSAAPNADQLSVAVLYIENLSRDTADQYLVDGLTEDLATSLGHVSRLLVKTPSAVKRAQAANRGDLPAIGKALGVRYVLEGSLRRTAGGVRVTAHLVEHSNETQAWSNTYDATPASLLDLPGKIAQDVGGALTGALSSADAAAAAKRPTRNAEAYDAYLRGSFYLAQRTREAAAAAHREFGRALSLDPAFSAARARDAHIYVQQVDYGWQPDGVKPAILVQRALAMIDTALRQDSLSADIWTARSYALQMSTPGRMLGSREAGERAVALDPRSLEALNRLGWGLWYVGDNAGAGRMGREMLALDRNFFVAYWLQGSASFLDGRYAEARVMLDSAIQLSPRSATPYHWRARVRFLLGDSVGARADAAEQDRLGGVNNVWHSYYLKAVSGDAMAARRWLDQRAPSTEPQDEALVWLSLHEPARALDLLERDAGKIRGWHYLHAPEFTPIANDPRFKAVVERVRALTMVR
jgi:serine/threonine-protein kinase